MAKKVYIPEAVAQEGVDFLLEQGYEIIHGSDLLPETFCREVADCDAVLLRTMSCPETLLASGKNLKIVARHGVGYDNVDRKTGYLGDKHAAGAVGLRGRVYVGGHAGGSQKYSSVQ